MSDSSLNDRNILSTMSSRMIVCISGKKEAGKSTLAKHLVEKHGFVELSFASPLKRGLQEIFGFSDEQMSDPVLKETKDSFWEVEPRRILQEVGTGVFREFLPLVFPGLKDFWIRRLFRDLDRLPPETRVVVSDVRFPNEFKAMQNCGALMVRVSRPNFQGDPAFANHGSETALDDYSIYTPDCLLVNDGTIEQFLHRFDEQFNVIQTLLSHQ